MKRFIIITLITVLFVCVVLPLPSFASNASPLSSNEIFYFDDGSYIETSIEEIMTRSSTIKDGIKKYTYRDSEGALLWTATLTARFTYTGTSSTCTNTATSTSITNNSWYLISKSSSKSGNTATGNFSFGYKFLGVTTKTLPVTLTLRCDANGNMS